MKRLIMILFILFFTLNCINCLPVLVGGLIYKSTKSNQEKQEFIENHNQTNLEREKAGLLPLDLCIAKYRFDEGWARSDETCEKIIAAYLNGEIDEYGQKVEKKDKPKK